MTSFATAAKMSSNKSEIINTECTQELLCICGYHSRLLAHEVYLLQFIANYKLL